LSISGPVHKTAHYKFFLPCPILYFFHLFHYINGCPEKFLAGIKDFTRLAVKNTSMETYKTEKETPGKCPLCGKPVFEGKKNYYCEGYKEGCKFVIWKEICTAPVGEADVKLLLAGKQTKAKKCKSKAGKEFQAAFYLKDGRVEFKFEERKK
jgi:DNA topoisomerase-3